MVPGMGQVEATQLISTIRLDHGHNLVLRLLNQHMQPDANVRANHVHQPKTSDQLVSGNHYAGVHEDKVQLNEGEDHVRAGRQAVHEGVAVLL